MKTMHKTAALMHKPPGRYSMDLPLVYRVKLVVDVEAIRQCTVHPFVPLLAHEFMQVAVIPSWSLVWSTGHAGMLV